MNTSHTTHKNYIRYSWFLVIMVFLVILAGGVVRMTQSGMGCPDWPKCFGLWIPPTDASQLPDNYQELMAKQDIDHSFNVYHTWIEYINRLLGALLGLFIIGYLVWTFRLFWKSKKGMVYIAFGLLIAVMIQGYLGKVVVDKNLSVGMVTIHMLGALIIAALPIWNITRLRNESISIPSALRNINLVFIILVLIQIVLGTQVREEIDVVSKSLAYEQRDLWIAQLGSVFYIHRTFSWSILLVALWTYFKGRKVTGYFKHVRLSMVLVLVIILLGIVMGNFGMPALAQPLHLLLACILLMQVFYSRLHTIKS